MDVRQPVEVEDRLAGLTARDGRRLRRRLDDARRIRAPQRRESAMADLGRKVDAAEARVESRRAAVPAVSYPAELPVSQRRDDIAAALRDAQVVVVAGETGSGKTTQLPKICLELGRGTRGLIGHTQPRRIAARAVAERLSEELATPLGEAVGYTVRFTDHVSDATLVKVMTDGILLAELQRDRDLLAYDTLIIDEAHERSLNIDFILGYLKALLPRRPDLKVVITSATIDVERFSRHFDDAPVVEVSGRAYPVEVRYRPYGIEEADDRDQVQAICDAVEELWTEGPGDVLVFLSGEREIRDTAEALRGMLLPETEILPLYARLSAAEQHRVFSSHPGRRVVLATNVAETSLTVPGIRYVVDPGTARISRYSSRLKVQRLPIEAVSQASANQRAGRCGRVQDGVCIRLYEEDDFVARPEFTDPEILRTNLASVILAMTSLGLGDIAAFPFVEPPDRRHVRDGVQLLEELGALEPAATGSDQRQLTPLGKRLAQLPLDPRLGRMVLEADTLGCTREVLVIAAALSIQDPRERPADKQQAADERHRRFADKSSDFLTYCALWEHLRTQQRELSSSAFRRQCKADFLNYLRIREWQDIESQLRQVLRQLGIRPSPTESHPDAVHQALLSGLLSHVGLRDVEKRDYLGARGARFAVSPGSALFKKPPRYVMAAELVETTRLWARGCAQIQPEWAERLGDHVVKRTYSEPHWEKDRAAVVAFEKVTLYGVPLVAGRKVSYGRIDPALSRELFLRHALVEGDWRTTHTFWHENRALLDEVGELEHRTRRRDIVVDDETLFDFYDQRVPPEVVSGRHFDAWWKKTRKETPDLLSFEKSMLVEDDATSVSARDYPDVWVHADLRLPLTYRFEPGAADDGVTVEIPSTVLNRVDPEVFRWQVPGLRHDLVTALIRSLPKALRVNFVPAPDVAQRALDQLRPYDGSLLEQLERVLWSLSGVRIPHGAWDLDRVPVHLQMTYRVVGEDGRTLATGKHLAGLQSRLAPRVRAEVARAAGIERSGLRSWDVGTLARSIEQERNGHVVRGFPALVDEGDTVAVRVLTSVADQEQAHRLGVRRLLLLGTASPVKGVVAALPNPTKLALGGSAYPSVPALLDDCVAAAADALMAECGEPPRDVDAYRTVHAHVRAELFGRTEDVVRAVAQVLAAAQAVDKLVRSTSSIALLPALTDVRGQVARLLPAGFVSQVGAARLPDLVRYLRAAERRVQVLPDSAGRDRTLQWQVEQVQQEYDALLDSLPPSRGSADDVLEIRWMIEELRVSLFAQTLGTPAPVSDKRIRRAIAAAALPTAGRS